MRDQPSYERPDRRRCKSGCGGEISMDGVSIMEKEGRMETFLWRHSHQ